MYSDNVWGNYPVATLGREKKLSLEKQACLMSRPTALSELSE